MRVISILILSVLFFMSCSEESPQQPAEKQQTDMNKKPQVSKAYQDKIQRAKDMEKEVLKAAEKQRKIIDGEL